MTQRAPNPQRRSARSQAAILKAAYELCQQQGYARLTIEGIAARAGVGKQTIYRWCQHRELIRAAQDRGELRADIDVDLMADAVFAPLWFRLLVTKAELSPKFADDITGTVLSGGADDQVRGPHR